MNNPPDFIRLFDDGLSISDSLYTAASSLKQKKKKKIGEGVSVGEGATVHRLVSDG